MMDVRMSAMTLILVAAVGLSPWASAQTRDEEVLTLDEAIQLARSNNRDLKQSELDVDRQREALDEAKTHLYPRIDTFVLAAQLLTPVDFTVRAGQLGSFPSTGPIPESDVALHTPARPIAIASVTATQPLTPLIRIHLSVVEQQRKIEAAQLSFDQREQKLTDVVRQSYYRVLQSQIEYESQQSMGKYLEEWLKPADRRSDKKAALNTDRLGDKAELAKASYQLTTIEDTLADSKDALN